MNARASRRFVAYYRVSTDRQGRSGLGIRRCCELIFSCPDGKAGLEAK
jgi:hypothetical protein